MELVAAENEEAMEAWSGVLFDRFVQYRDLIVGGLAQHGEAALEAYPPGPATACSTSAVVSAIRPSGSPCSSAPAAKPSVWTSQRRSIEASIAEAKAAGVENASFLTGDVQVMDLAGPFDYLFSRMGIMFFANPVAAMRNVRGALAPGGRLSGVVWRRKLDNEWMHRAEQVVEQYLEEPEESDEPRCGPGPFSMADADTVSEQLTIAGFEQIRCGAATCRSRSATTSTMPSRSTWPSGRPPR